jgi:Na+:H+ antiporter, NhaA family
MATGQRPIRHSWLASDRPVPRLIARPVQRFLETEASGGIILLIATCSALLWANSPLSESYGSLWTTEITLRIGAFEISEDLRHWINDGLMTVFFFVVGLEIKRELVAGELRGWRRAALPATAALGGMAAPALIYVAFNAGTDNLSGWGIPMATDIAFAVGVLALVARQAPSSLKTLLLSIAIVDDIGAIVVIALFYTAQIHLVWLLIAVALTGVVVAMKRLQIWWTPLYAVVGTALWFATLESGVHATIAGVALGLITPALPADPEGGRDAAEEADRMARDRDPATIRHINRQSQELVSVAERLEHLLHPWTSYLIIPIFAVANAGVRLVGTDMADAVTSPVVLGVAMGLVIGKLVGVSGASWLSVRLGFGELPEGLGWMHVMGCGAVAGIGFTVALFISNLAFEGGGALQKAKLGILVGSALAAVVGAAILHAGARESEE